MPLFAVDQVAVGIFLAAVERQRGGPGAVIVLAERVLADAPVVEVAHQVELLGPFQARHGKGDAVLAPAHLAFG